MSFLTPGMVRLAEFAVIEKTLKTLFKNIYGEQKANKLEGTLNNILKRYKYKNRLHQDLVDKSKDNVLDEDFEKCLDDVNKEFEKCLDDVCQELQQTKENSHTPQSLKKLADCFFRIGDYRLACEMIWGSAALSIKEFLERHDLHQDITLNSHDSKRNFINALFPKDHQHYNIAKEFKTLDGCHSAFYTDNNTKEDMIIAFDVLEEFNKTLGALPLTVDQKTALKGTDFYRKV